jgi:hypothetical protein
MSKEDSISKNNVFKIGDETNAKTNEIYSVETTFKNENNSKMFHNDSLNVDLVDNLNNSTNKSQV